MNIDNPDDVTDEDCQRGWTDDDMVTDDERIRGIAQEMSDASGQCVTAGDVRRLLHNFMPTADVTPIGILAYAAPEYKPLPKLIDKRKEQKRQWRREVWKR